MQTGSTDQETQAEGTGQKDQGKLLSVRLRPAAKRHLDRYALQVQFEKGKRIPLSQVLEDLILGIKLKDQIDVSEASNS